MSIAHHLELTAAAGAPEQLTRALRAPAADAGLVAEVYEPEGPESVVLTLRSGLVVSGSRPVMRRGPDEDQILRDFGVARAVTVDMRIRSSLDSAPQVDEMLWLAFTAMAHVPGDALLHEDYYRVWLLRKDGRMVLNDDAELWLPERLSRVPGPYELAPLMFSDTTLGPPTPIDRSI